MEKITITHFKNPQRFWFKPEDCVMNEEIPAFRAEVNRAVRKTGVPDSWTPAEGEVVVYFQKHWSVWDRAVVQSISPDGDLTLWFPDMGFPQRAKRKEIRPMPPGVNIPKTKIVREGGIFGIIPAERRFNFETFSMDLMDSGGVWSQKAIDLMEEAIDKAESVSFELKESQGLVSYGNLSFHMPNGRILPAELLLADYSRKSGQFLKLLPRDDGPKRLERSIEEAVATKDYVNGWIEKTVDIQNDTFDESVSTYHQPESRKNPPATAKPSEWDELLKPALPAPERKSYDSEEDEFGGPPCRQANGASHRGGRKSSDISHKTTSDQEARNHYEAQTKRAKDLFLQQFRKSPDPPVQQSSSRAHLNPQPAGLIHAHDVPNIKKSQRGRNRNAKSLESNVKHLGEGVVGVTAKKRYQRVLVHGPLNVTMVEKIGEAFFRPEVHEKLKDYRIGDVHRIQSHAWPHIFRNGSIILIGRRMSGKTLAYLPMLYTLMMNEKEKEEGDLPVGARAIVICASSKKALQANAVFDLYHERGKRKLSALVSCSPRDTADHVIELQNGYDVLFTTAPALKRLMQGASKETVELLTLDDIRYVVVDDYDVVSANFKSELSYLLKILLSRVDEHGLCKPQVVFTSCRWMPEFREHWKKFDNPLLCIASGLESAMYAGVKFQLEIMSKEQKVLAIRQILETEMYFSEPTMIVCNTGEEVDYLMDILLKVSISAMAFKEPSQHLLQIKEKAVTICTDACVMDINVRNIQTLIHFSLPEKWSMFDNRFVACFDYYEDQLVCEESSKAPATIHIFLDQDNDQQLPKIISFMKSRFSNLDISPEIMHCAEATLRRREEVKITEGVTLCPDMMEFGDCVIQKIDCSYRHMFCEADAAESLLPKKGFLSMKILSVVTPLHYKCQLLYSMNGRIDPYDKWTVVNESNRFNVFQNDLNRYMSVESNRITPASADVVENGIYVYQNDHNFLRVSVDSLKKDKSSVYVTISGVDSPKKVHKHLAQELLVLPEEFRNFPHQLVNVHLFGLMPNDYEYQWDRKSIQMVESWVKPYEKSAHEFFVGEIELTLKNTVYVKTLLCVEYFESNQSNFQKFNLSSQILKNQLAVKNDKLEFVKHLAQYYGIYNEPEEANCEVVEPVEKGEVEEVKVVKVSEKWQTLAHETLINVEILDFNSPREFYVQDLTKIKELQELNGKIKAFVDKNELKSCEELKIGDYCLVPLNDNFYRGKVWEETPEEDVFHVRLMDEGINEVYNMSDIYEIPQSLIEEIPFFAIRCSLLGVKEGALRLKEEELDEIYDRLIQGPNDDRTLYVYPMDERTLRRGEMWSLVNYSVVLLVDDPEERYVINKCFVEEKFYEKDERKWAQVDKFIADMKSLPKILSQLAAEDEDVLDWEHGIPSSAIKRKEKKEKAAKEGSDTATSLRGSSDDLKLIFQAPHVEWYQTNREVVLTVSTIDMKDYRLELKPSYLTLCILFEEKPQQGCLINLFGCIDPDGSSVRARTNALTIRLRKQVPGKQYLWPYLSDSPEKLPWIKKAIDVVSSDSEESDDELKHEKLGHFVEENDEDEEEANSQEEDPNSDDELCFGGHFVPKE